MTHAQAGTTRWILHTKGQNVVSLHYSDIIMSMMVSQITGVCLSTQPLVQAQIKKHQSSTSLAFMMGINWWPVNSPQKGPVTRKMFSFDDAIMVSLLPALASCWTNCQIATDLRWYPSMLIWCHGNGSSYHFLPILTWWKPRYCSTVLEAKNTSPSHVTTNMKPFRACKQPD